MSRYNDAPLQGGFRLPPGPVSNWTNILDKSALVRIGLRLWKENSDCFSPGQKSAITRQMKKVGIVNSSHPNFYWCLGIAYLIDSMKALIYQTRARKAKQEIRARIQRLLNLPAVKKLIPLLKTLTASLHRPLKPRGADEYIRGNSPYNATARLGPLGELTETPLEGPSNSGAILTFAPKIPDFAGRVTGRRKTDPKKALLLGPLPARSRPPTVPKEVIEIDGIRYPATDASRRLLARIADREVAAEASTAQKAPRKAVASKAPRKAIASKAPRKAIASKRMLTPEDYAVAAIKRRRLTPMQKQALQRARETRKQILQEN